MNGKLENWVGQAAESKGKARRGICGSGATRRRPESLGRKSRRGDLKPQFFFHQIAAGKQQSFTTPRTSVCLLCALHSNTHSEASSPSEKHWLKLSQRAAPVGESRKRCLDHSPVNRLLSSAASGSLGRWPYRVTRGIGELTRNKALAKGRYYPAPAATSATAGRPRAGSDATALSTSGAAESAPREEGARALTGVGPSSPPPPLRLCLTPLARPDLVWSARAERPRAAAPGKCAARVAALFTPPGRGGGWALRAPP